MNTDLEWGRIAGFAVLFAVGILLFIALISGVASKNIASECDKAGRTVLEGVAYSCERLKSTGETP